MTACAKPDVLNHTKRTPALVLEEYFDGAFTAYGVFVDRFGKLRRELQVNITGTWDGTTLILDEDFFYKDGMRETRVWRITKNPDGSYTGRADDVLGEATGRGAGSVFRWAYKMNLSVNGDLWKVSFDDWFYLQDDGVLINRAVARRWGIQIGTVILTFVPKEKNAPMAHAAQ